MLEGFNRGTKNMIDWEPVGSEGLYPVDIVHKGKYRSDVFGGSITVPKFLEKKYQTRSRIREMVTARHEARERVREIAALEKGRGPYDTAAVDQIGSSHMPGVVADERIAYNALENSIGERPEWSLRDVHEGRSRGTRDIYIGKHQPKFEFDLHKRWSMQAQKDNADALKILDDVNKDKDVEALLRRYHIMRPGGSHDIWIKKLEDLKRSLHPALSDESYKKIDRVRGMLRKWRPVSANEALAHAYNGMMIPAGRRGYLSHDDALNLLSDYRRLVNDRVRAKSQNIFLRAKGLEDVLDTAFGRKVLRPDKDMAHVM